MSLYFVQPNSKCIREIKSKLFLNHVAKVAELVHELLHAN
jgi:hypothetical protein